MRHLLPLVWAVVLVGPMSAFAAGLLEQLPDDGIWVKYHVRAKSERSGERAFELTLRLVGTVRERGQTWRWIEEDWHPQGDCRNCEFTVKTLMAEPRPGKPLEIARGWQKARGGVEPISKSDALSTLRQWLPIERTDFESADEPWTVDYQRGRLRGRLIQRGRISLQTPAKCEVVRTYQPHPDVPFGFAAVRQRITYYSRDGSAFDRQEMDYTLIDYGTGAKSELPDRE